ncbi:MAG: hypothetical protein LBC88_09650 [Spirochaetaceae bacterium]|jgi:hypothetical protein|nr:hypothetical protein [Spirochaetaceae bacterium]
MKQTVFVKITLVVGLACFPALWGSGRAALAAQELPSPEAGVPEAGVPETGAPEAAAPEDAALEPPRAEYREAAVPAFIDTAFADTALTVPAGTEYAGMTRLARGPHRTVEAGFDLGLFAANNVAALGDIFNIRRTITLNFNKISVRALSLGAGADAEVFFNLAIGKANGDAIGQAPGGLRFGFFAEAEASGYAWASKDLIRFLKEGNSTPDVNGTGRAGMSAFAAAGLTASFPVKRLMITARPAVYVPLIYAVPRSVRYNAVIGMDLSLDADVVMDLYSAWPIQDGSMVPEGSLPLGADLSLAAVYPLLPRLDLGVTLGHIPLFPAALHHRSRFEAHYRYDLQNGLDADDPVTAPEPDGDFLAFRPLRVQFFAEYLPVAEIDLFVIRPAIGFSLLTVYGYGEFCFNAELEGQVNILKGFSMKLSTALRERIYRQSLSFMINTRVFELHLRLSLQGTDFASSFSARGVGVSVGMRFGY